MFLPVGTETGFLREALLADVANIRFFPGVYPFMSNNVTPVMETFSAEPADVGPLVCVGPAVCF